jgi:DNA-binding LytR/AlgR family response regulator
MPSCVIAEDEALLRESLLAQLREAWPELEIVAACEDGGAALDAIGEHKPEVAFLDIRMPGLSGLEVAAAAAEASPATQIVFVTAYNQYAIDAFDKGAVDYLLKPIARERLAATVRRLQQRLQQNESTPAPDLVALIRELSSTTARPAREPLAWITASTGKETRLILIDDVAYFRADNKYTVVMTAQGEALLRKPIRDLLDLLDPAVFKQIHRATIVNLKAVASIVRAESGKGTLKLKTRPETLTVSAPFMPLFRSM